MIGHHSRQQREAHSRRRKPMPLRVREDRQEAEGRKRPLRMAPSPWLVEGIDGEDGAPAKYDAVVRHR